MTEHNVRFLPDDQIDDLADLIIATAYEGLPLKVCSEYFWMHGYNQIRCS